MKSHDVFADEVDLLQIRVGHVGVVVFAALVQQVFQRRQVAHRRVQPDIKVLARRVGDLNAKVRRVTRDVPVAQTFAGRAVGVGAHRKPLFDLVGHFGLQLAVLRPLAQKLHAARVGQLEEKVLRGLQFRLGTRQGRERVDQVGGGVNRTAHLAVVAVLVFGVALGALAFDEAVGQKHVLLRVKELFDRAHLDQRATIGRRNVAQVTVNLAGQLVVFWRVGAVPVVELDVKTVQIRLAACRDVCHELLGRLARFFGRDHDRRAMRVVGTHKVDLAALHALETDPNVGLDVFHDVADVEIAVGVGQGGGDKKLAWHGGGRHGGAVCRVIVDFRVYGAACR